MVVAHQPFGLTFWDHKSEAPHHSGFRWSVGDMHVFAAS
jgi:hypothetical protein